MIKGRHAIDVVDNGIRPVITTGIAHREAGVGQIGAGIVRAPMRAVISLIDTDSSKWKL